MFLTPVLRCPAECRRGRCSRRGGFTLVELMVVVLIISVLATLAIPAFQRIQRKSRTTVIVNDFRVFSNAFSTYAQEMGAWPVQCAAGTFPPGMDQRINKTAWLRPTLMGGQYSWQNNQNNLGTTDQADIAIMATGSAPLPLNVTQLTDLEQMIDSPTTIDWLGGNLPPRHGIGAALRDPALSDAPTFAVTLHHLAPGAKQAGVGFPDLPLTEVPAKKLRELILTLATLASTNLGTASPELRVVAPHGQFVVQISQGRLRINSWSIKVGGADLSPEQIFTLINGAEAVADAIGVDLDVGLPKRSRGATVVALAVLIIGSNAITAWMLMRPQPSPPLLPEFTSLAQEPADRFIAQIAGEYRAGTNVGARVLKIAKDGHVRWSRLGPNGTMTDDTELPVRPVQSHGKPALLADARALIEAPDPSTLVFYNENYRRKTP